MNYQIFFKWIIALCVMASTAANAAIEVRITDGIDESLPIMIAPFAGDAQAAKIIEADFDRSGRFQLIDPAKAGQRLELGKPFNLDLIKRSGADYVVVGSQTDALSVELISTATGERVAGYRIPPHPNHRRMSHKAADLLFEKMIGIRGAFDTRLAYVLASGEAQHQTFQLMVADADGYNPQMVMQSNKPILSPAWSADGRFLAYSSFEKDHSAVFIQDLKSGDKRVLLLYEGTNGSPAWSPDGSQIAISLTDEDNTDIYAVNVRNGAIKRVTQDRAIDTEPVWASNNTIVYTSDQGGKPQLYQTTVNGGDGQRITFQGDYNAAPSIVKNKIAMVRQLGAGFKIAIMNASTKDSANVSKGGADESPSLAPNGAMVVYATRAGGREQIAVSSDNGKSRQFLPIQGGSARDPAWSPYLP